MAKKHQTVKTPRKRQGIVMRTYEGGVGMVTKHWVTGIVALITSSIIPILQQWHSDKEVTDSINSVATEAAGDTKDCEARVDKKIDDLKTDENAKIKALWDVVKTKQDKKGNQ
jgi:hypothetical protein